MLEEALEHLVRGIVDNPDDVRVHAKRIRGGRVLEIDFLSTECERVAQLTVRAAERLPAHTERALVEPRRRLDVGDR